MHPDDIDTLIRRFGGPTSAANPERFIPGRYPYTYAWDYLRQVLPGQWSRAEISGAVRDYCVVNDLTHSEVAEALADRYLARNGIEKPS